MPPKQNPFSLYDFLGYFVPGAALVYAYLILERMLETHHGSTTVLLSDQQLHGVADFLPIIIIAYIAGHLLSFISSITIERYSIWQVGYPSQFLLNRRPGDYFAVGEPKWLRRAYRVFVPVLLLPLALPDIVLGRGLGLREAYSRPLDPFLASIIDAKLRALVHHLDLSGSHEIPAGADVFRLAYHFTVENAPAHLPKMQNYVALYGFLRTTCMVFVTAWWFVVWIGLAVGSTWSQILENASWGAVFSFLLFMGFMKFYRRFSLEVLMALAAIEIEPRVRA